MTEERFRTVERRLQRLEDERAIEQMIARYGPLVDAGEADAAAALWAEDGTYQVEGWTMRNRAEVAAMVRSPEHQSLIGHGCCHFLGPAVVTVNGDEAVAVCESVLLVHRDGRFMVARAGANHFRLRRTDRQWQITARTTRALDGNPEARQLLSDVAGK